MTYTADQAAAIAAAKLAERTTEQLCCDLRPEYAHRSRLDHGRAGAPRPEGLRCLAGLLRPGIGGQPRLVLSARVSRPPQHKQRNPQ